VDPIRDRSSMKILTEVNPTVSLPESQFVTTMEVPDRGKVPKKSDCRHVHLVRSNRNFRGKSAHNQVKVKREETGSRESAGGHPSSDTPVSTLSSTSRQFDEKKKPVGPKNEDARPL